MTTDITIKITPKLLKECDLPADLLLNQAFGILNTTIAELRTNQALEGAVRNLDAASALFRRAVELLEQSTDSQGWLRERLRELFKDRSNNFTQTTVGVKVGMSQSSVSAFLNGKKINAHKYKLLLDFYMKTGNAETMPKLLTPSLKLDGFLKMFEPWIQAEHSIVNVAINGSHAHGKAHADSDIDLVILTDNKDRFVKDTSWTHRFGTVSEITVETHGVLSAIRVWYDTHGEVEFGIVETSWANIPVDPGTQRVITDGVRILLDRDGRLEALVKEVSVSAK